MLSGHYHLLFANAPLRSGGVCIYIWHQILAVCETHRHFVAVVFNFWFSMYHQVVSRKVGMELISFWSLLIIWCIELEYKCHKAKH